MREIHISIFLAGTVILASCNLFAKDKIKNKRRKW